MPNEPAFEIRMTDGTEPGGTLLVGVADPGMAGLTAADYLVTNVEADQIGYVSTRHLPDITPFSEGRPRHPMRLYDVADGDVTVLLSEVLLPVGIADLWGDAVLEWTDATDIEEIGVLQGASFPHGEHEHTVFHVGTDEFRDRHFADDDDIVPLPGGFFDGAVAELMVRGLEGSAPPVGALVTPAHPPGPDFDAALRLLDVFESVYGVSVDESELHQRSEDVKQYYQGLAERMRTLRDADRSEGRDYPEDRMYM